MTKRLICLIVAIIMAATVIMVPASAAGSTEYVIRLENGDYIEVFISASPARASTSGSTVYVYRNTSGTAQWQAVLRGMFKYDGTTSEATSAVCNVTIYNDAWSKDSQSNWVSGNTAYASVSMGLKTPSGAVIKDTYTLTLSCDKSGNLS